MLSENSISEDNLNVLKFDQDNFRSLDFHNADIERLKKMLGDVDWKTLRSHCSFEEFLVVFTDTLLKMCLICCPRENIRNGRPMALNALRRKKPWLCPVLKQIRNISLASPIFSPNLSPALLH